MFAQEMLYQRVQNIFSRTSCIAILWFDDRILEEIYETYYVRMYRNWDRTIMRLCHCVKNIRIRSYSGPYFPPFGLNTEREREIRISPYSVQMRENTDLQIPTLFTQSAVSSFFSVFNPYMKRSYNNAIRYWILYLHYLNSI